MIGFIGFACRPLQHEAIICSLVFYKRGLSVLLDMWVDHLPPLCLQHKLEGALLALGQFQHALDELLAWLTHTEGLLGEQKPVGGDPKAIEIELAKHHVCGCYCIVCFLLSAFLGSPDVSGLFLF